MKFISLLAFALVLTAPGARAAGWPKPQLTYYNTATITQAEERAHQWRQLSEANFATHATLTGSMLPYIHGGDREFLLMQRYTNQPLRLGMVVSFNRADKTPRCLHMIAAMSADGEWLYLSGTNNRRSDGWFHRSKVNAILREIVTLPSEGTR